MVLGNFNLSEIIRFAEVGKGLANPMLSVLCLFLSTMLSVFRSRAALQVEILALRHQICVLRRSGKKRPRLTVADRVFWAWLSEAWADWRSALVIVKPETVIAWHRKGFRLFWTWKVRHGQTGRPTVSQDVRDLIRTMSLANPLWGAPRVHGELPKLGIDIGQTSVSKYMVRQRKPPSQTWRTFLDNHVQQLVSVDFFTVPTIRFEVLYVFLVLAHERRRILHFNITAHPTAEWTAQQLRNTFPWDSAPLSVARSEPNLHQTGPGHGYAGSAFCAASAVAKSLRRARDRHHPARVPRSYDHLQRSGTLPADQVVHGILSRIQNASFASQGLAGVARSAATGTRTNRGCPASGRSPSPLRPARS